MLLTENLTNTELYLYHDKIYSDMINSSKVQVIDYIHATELRLADDNTVLVEYSVEGRFQNNDIEEQNILIQEKLESACE